MPAFRYVAVNPGGEVATGVMEAASEAAVVEALRRQGCVPMRAEPLSGRHALSGLLRLEIGRPRRLRRQDVAAVLRELAVMLAAGQDLDRALRYVVEAAPNARVRAVMDRVRAAVRDGAALSAAMAQHPDSFAALHVGMVRAGEAGGTLAATLDHLATLLERQRSMTATVQSALIYPALLTVAAIGSIVLLLTDVLPQFVPLFQQSGAELPGPTRFLIAAGDFVARDGVALALGFVVLALGLRQALRAPGPRLAFDRMVLRVPVLGGLVREVVAARFTRTFGTLLVNGVRLVPALGIARDAVGNSAGAVALDRAAQSARTGAGLSQPLAEAGVLPSRTIHLLRLGEETAQLGPLALRAAEIHEERARLGLQRLVALLVPVITIVMGAAVAFIVSSLLLAMLSLNALAQ